MAGSRIAGQTREPHGDDNRLARGIATAFDRNCFNAPRGAPLAGHREARIVAEALAINASLFLVSTV